MSATPQNQKGKARAFRESSETSSTIDDQSRTRSARLTRARLSASICQDVYDPHQDKDLIRGTRKVLREFEEKANVMKDNATAISAQEFDSQLQHLDQTFHDHVRAPAEATLDSRALRLLSEAALKKSRSLKTDINAFDGDEFVQRFIQVMSKKTSIEPVGDSSDDDSAQDLIDWNRVGRRLMRFSRRAPAMDFMYGPLEIQHKKRKFSQRAKLEKNEADKKQPELIKSDDIERSANEMTRMIIKIGNLLTAKGGSGGMNLFEFFINPNSFAQSVENLFCLSFLIRDGKAAIEILDENDVPLEVPIVYTSEVPSAADQQRGHVKTQVILELTMKDWQDAIDIYGIRESVIPHREDPAQNQSSQSKWH